MDARSEAFRDLLRDELDKKRLQVGGAGYCVDVLSYVYNHHERDLPRRLTIMQHGYHDVTVATLHAHLDPDNCIESVILRAPPPLSWPSRRPPPLLFISTWLF